MNIFKNIKSYFSNEKKLIKENKEAVCSSNLFFATLLIACCAIFCVVLFIVSFFSESFANLKLGYSLMFFINMLALFVLYKFKKLAMYPLTYYVFYVLLAIYPIYSSAFVTPDYVSVIILIFLFEMPVIIIDRTIRII